MLYGVIFLISLVLSALYYGRWIHRRRKNKFYSDCGMDKDGTWQEELLGYQSRDEKVK